MCKWPLQIDGVRTADQFHLATHLHNASCVARQLRVANDPQPPMCGEDSMSRDGTVITFSHFLPRRELLPSVQQLRFKQLPFVAGDPCLDQVLRHKGSTI